MKNHKGFTIVELLIGMTILSIVAVALTGFIVSSSKSYAASNTEIIVQQESQLAMNQISDVVIDTTRSVNYVGYSLDGSVSEQVVKDSDFTIDVEDKSLVLYNGEVEYEVDENGEFVLDGDGNLVIATEEDGTQKMDDGNGNMNYQIYWDKSEEKLFFTQLDISNTDFSTGEQFVLAEYVKDFSVDLSQVEEKRVVKLTISYGYNNKVYETSNNITIRNKVLVNSVNLVVNKSIELSIRAKEKMVVLEPGEDYYKFSTPIVGGRNVMDKSVTWSIPAEEQSKLTGWDTGFTDAANGMIHISSAEQANSFKVVVTTNAMDSAGNQASDEVTVYVKRAKHITVYKSADDNPENGPNIISPGCTFTVTANVEGNKLDVTCSKCGDDTAMDRQVVSAGNPYGNPYEWHIYNEPGWDPSHWLSLIDSDEYSATYYLSPDAPDDGSHRYVIQCMSLLSTQGNDCGRHYDNWVPGAIELTVKKNKKANITAGGSLHWGASTLISWEELSYFHYYVICARVREYGAEGGDKIMMYLSEGTTTRVTPDMFGVDDVSKPWYLSLQVLNPGKEIPPGVDLHEQSPIKIGAQIDDPIVLDIIDDYLNNCDSTGTYVGTKYLHSDKLEATINPPEIYYEYNGEKNLGGELKLKPVSILGGAAWTEFKVDYVRNTRDEVLGYWFANNNIKFSVYKQTADGGLQKIYWYNAEGDYYEGDSRPYGGLLQLDEIKSATGVKIKLDFNNMGRASEAVGKYLLIPTIKYKQDAGADHAGGVPVYYVSYIPKYDNEQYYEDERSTVYYELTGGNLNDLWTNSYGKFYKGEIYFPVPSDSEFSKYFDLPITSEQSYSGYNYFRLKDKDGNIQGIEFSRMTCKYISTEDTYEIELFYRYQDNFWGGDKYFEISAGRFSCKSNGTEWTRVQVGDFDESLNNGKEIILNGTMRQIWLKTQNNGFIQGEIYFPTPSDNSFNTLFGSLTSQESKTVSLNNRNFKVRGTDGNSYGEVSFTKAVGKLNADGSYAVELFYNCKDDFWGKDIEISAGTYVCAAGGNKWTKTGAGTYDEKLAKGETVRYEGNATITKDGKTYNAYIPFPTDASFTNNWEFGFDLEAFKNGTKPTQIVERGYGLDIYYEESVTSSSSSKLTCSKLECSYDAVSKTYTLKATGTDYNVWPNVTYDLGTFTYTEGGNTWVKK